MASQRAPVIPPQQVRSRRTYDRLIAAITASAADGSLPDITLPQLAKRAGVSTGAFYGRFAGKAAAVTAVLERQQAALRSRLSLLGAQARAGRDVRGWIEAVAKAIQPRMAPISIRPNAPSIRMAKASNRASSRREKD